MIRYNLKDIKKYGYVDENLLNKALRELKERSYGFQDKLQLDSVVLERFDFSIRDFNKTVVDDSVLPVRRKYLAYADLEFIHPQRKLKFKRSGLMGKELSMFDVSENSNIFDKNFMFFINGKLMDCVTIIPGGDGIQLVLNIFNGTDNFGVNILTFNEWITNNAKATIIFFSNSEFNPLITNRQILSDNKEFLSLQESGIIDELESDETYITFITSNGMGYSSNLVDTTNKDKLLSFFEEVDSGTSKERAFINIFGFRNLSEMKTIASGINTFQIPGYKMPVPVENILVFRETPNGREFATDITLSRSFPNFYTVSGNDDNSQLSLLIFFSEQNEEGEGYINEIEGYYKIMGDNTEAFLNAPDIIKNFKPEDMEYSIDDFISSGISVPLQYKLDKLSELADKNPEFIRDYFKDQFETTDGFYVDLNNIDLTQRLRNDNHTEIINPSQQVTFPEERYVITFKDLDDDNKYDYRIFIDGELYAPDIIYENGEYHHVYIPTDKLKPDSFIEVERFLIGESERSVSYNTSRTTNYIDIPSGIYTYDDLFVVRDDTGEILDTKKFQVYTILPSTELNIIDPLDPHYIQQTRVYFKLLDPSLNNVPMTIHVERYSHLDKRTIDMSDDHHEFSSPIMTNPKNNHLRTFINGRLIQPYYVGFDHDGIYSNNTDLTTLLYSDEGDEIILDYTPNEYDLVLDLDVMPENNIIYLHGIIDIPFDLQWYDLYVNGKRMTKRNIEKLSPYLLQIKNVESIRNVTIYSRKRPDEAVYPNPATKTIIDTLWETDMTFKDAVLSYPNNSSDIEPDIITSNTYSYMYQLKMLFENEMKYRIYHINPDIEQITQEMIDKYNLVFKDTTILHLNGDDLFGSEKTEILHINPDETF